MRRIIFTICFAVSACAPIGADPVSPAAGPGEGATADAPVEVTARQPTALPTNTAAPEVSASEAGGEPGTTVEPEETPSPATTTAQPATPTSAASPTAGVVTNGRTADGAYFLGRSDAPVTIIDYSDFL